MTRIFLHVTTWKTTLLSFLVHGAFFGVVAFVVRDSATETFPPKGEPTLWVQVASTGKSTDQAVTSVPSAIVPEISKSVAKNALLSQARPKLSRYSKQARSSKKAAANGRAATRKGKSVPLSASSAIPFGGENGALQANEKQIYKAQLVEILMKNRDYPDSAEELEQQGTVFVYCKILPNGQLAETRIEKPSRYPILNRASLDLFRRIGKFPPLPPSLRKDSFVITLPVVYTLDGST